MNVFIRRRASKRAVPKSVLMLYQRDGHARQRPWDRSCRTPEYLMLARSAASSPVSCALR